MFVERMRLTNYIQKPKNTKFFCDLIVGSEPKFCGDHEYHHENFVAQTVRALRVVL